MLQDVGHLVDYQDMQHFLEEQSLIELCSNCGSEVYLPHVESWFVDDTDGITKILCTNCNTQEDT